MHIYRSTPSATPALYDISQTTLNLSLHTILKRSLNLEATTTRFVSIWRIVLFISKVCPHHMLILDSRCTLQVHAS